MLKALGEMKPQGLEDRVWVELQVRATILVRLFLACDVMCYVMDLLSPKEAWKKLESRNMLVCSDGDLSSRQFSDSWIFDTRCSFYISPNKDLFDSYTK